jgi:hypothetical protein
MSLRPGNDVRLSSLAVIRWRGFDGAPISSYPLPRPLAEAVARAFAATSPRERFWVEDISWLRPIKLAVTAVEHAAPPAAEQLPGARPRFQNP